MKSSAASDIIIALHKHKIYCQDALKTTYLCNGVNLYKYLINASRDALKTERLSNKLDKINKCLECSQRRINCS